MEPIKRPSFGSVGTPMKVRANFFEVTALPQADIIHYDVTITPKAPSRLTEVPPRLNRRVFQRFAEANLKGFKPVYDGIKNAFAHKILPFGNFGTFDVELQDDGPAAGKRPPQFYQIELKKVGNIIMGDLVKFLNAKSKFTEDCQTAIMALDILIRHEPSIKFTAVSGRINRSFYTPDETKTLNGGLEAWQGYYQSARPTYGRMMINIDLCATAFYEEGPLVQLVTKILGRRIPDDLRRGISDKEHEKIERTIKHLRIKDNHMPGKQRKFKIERLTKTSASDTKFDQDGTEISVQDYFLKHHGKKLNYAYLPCVVVRRGWSLPMEVCEVIKGQRYLRKLDGKQTKDMLKFTCQNPNSRANKIQAGLNILSYRNNEYLRQFGMRVSNDMAVVDARVLPAPTIQYHPSSREHTIRPSFGAWNLRDKKVTAGATLSSWSVVSFQNKNRLPKGEIDIFIRELVDTCQHTGMNIPNKRPPITYANPQGDIQDTLKKAWVGAGNAAKAQPQLILCILPDDGVQLYAEIKRVTDTVIGVASQCVQSNHTKKANKQYCANVCLKINVKLGGMNSFIIPEQIPFISDKPTILMGADVTHHGPGETQRPSIAALCSSMDVRASRYAASISLQKARTEIIANLENMVKGSLKTFYQTCGRKPERILFYRDGVSEGEFSKVLVDELSAVRAACLSLEDNYKPTITFVVVQKRHHTRFFPMDRRNTDKTGNCLPGTVIEKDITHPFEFDFYLQSHPGLQGTSRPTHYHVLFDENGFDSDKMQTLTYNLCYLFARCTRAVSLVPPVYYAHLVCARARFHSPWSDTESSEEGASAASYSEVKQELRKVMYYM